MAKTWAKTARRRFQRSWPKRVTVRGGFPVMLPSGRDQRGPRRRCLPCPIANCPLAVAGALANALFKWSFCLQHILQNEREQALAAWQAAWQNAPCCTAALPYHNVRRTCLHPYMLAPIFAPMPVAHAPCGLPGTLACKAHPACATRHHHNLPSCTSTTCQPNRPLRCITRYGAPSSAGTARITARFQAVYASFHCRRCLAASDGAPACLSAC